MYLPEHLDMRTLMFVFALICGLSAVAMASFAWRFRQFSGLIWLPAADLALMSGMLLIALRGQIDTRLTVFLADVLLLLGLQFNFEAARRFAGVSALRYGLPQVLWLFGVPALWYYSEVAPGVQERIFIFSAGAAWISASAMAVLFLRKRDEHINAHYLTLGVFALAAALSVACCVLALVQDPIDSYLTAGWTQALPVLLYLLFVLMKNFSFMQDTSARLIAKSMQQARTDTLTGRLNRRALLEQGGIEFERARRQGLQLSAIMVDIDHFKAINDGYGHKVGDVVLVRLSALLAQHIRKFDLCARFGGEEFILLLPGTPLSVAVCVAEKLRATLAAEGWPELDGRRTTASFGVASNSGQENLQELIAASDRALYKAKNNGRNCVESVAI